MKFLSSALEVVPGCARTCPWARSLFFICVTPNARSNDGTDVPPVELTASTAILNFGFFDRFAIH